MLWTLLGSLFTPIMVLAQSADSTMNSGNSPDSGSGVGYIILAALVVIVIIFVLLRKQHRKFNE